MKYIYVSLQRSALLCLIVLWLVPLASNPVFAQQKTGYENGVVRIKVKESLALQLENARMTKSANNTLLTGIQSIDRVSVKYKATGIKRVFRPAGKFEARHRKYGLHLWFEIQLDKAAPILAVLDAYKSIEQIELVQPLYKKAIIGSDRLDYGPRKIDVSSAPILVGAPNDPMFTQQWHYNNTGQAFGTPGSDISLLQAWGITTGSTNVIVAVIDGGAQVNHPDLAASMWVNEDEIPGNGLDDDNNGYVDDINGYGFSDNTGNIAPDDHGSHVSGTIGAATNNGIGVAGIAGGSGIGDGVRLMSCAVFSENSVGGFEDSFIYGADNGAVISQNSWGYTIPGVFDQSILDAIDYFIAEAGRDEFGNQFGPMKGGIVIFAAGNDDDDGRFYPGFYEPTLAVGAVNNKDKKAVYSNFGTWVDIAAPGGETFVNNDHRGVLSTISNGQYAFFQGTSMATPHVSGVAALIVSKFGGPGFTPEMLRGRLTQLTDNIDAADPAFAGLLGSGRLNAFSALQENDGSAPEAITDLSDSIVAITDITLTWTAPFDSGSGRASVYDIRYSTSPIKEQNFGDATSYPNPSVPKAAGAKESLTISGLLPGTVYFFAIKSADFFGNFSSVSNILQQATNFAPVITLSSTSLTQNLQTAETGSQILTIGNTGQGVLNFTFTGLGDFATSSLESGSVDPGASLDVPITFDANNLLGGSYNSSFVIVNNDPLHDSLFVSLTLNVTNNGSPIASVTPDTINFGNVFETDTTSRSMYVHNAGSKPLRITSIRSDNPDFTPYFSGTISVGSFHTAIVKVTYTASSLGLSSGNITISTNDAAHPSLTVSVWGTGVMAPNIDVSPDSLIAFLGTDKTSTQSLTIQNTGGSDLTFSIAITSAAASRVAAVQTVSVPSKSGASLSGQKQTASSAGKYSNPINLKSVGNSPEVSKVLIVSPDADVTDLASILNGFDDIEATILPVAVLPYLLLDTLLMYDVVMTVNNSAWLESGGIDPEVIGDLLADYIDAGGKVIVNQYAYAYDALQMAGRFIRDRYGPFIQEIDYFDFDLKLGKILIPDHPIMEGVSSLEYTGRFQVLQLGPDAIALAEWDNGVVFLATKSNVVGFCISPSLGNGRPAQWSGDLPILYQNAVRYLTGRGSPADDPFVRLSLSEGTVAPGEQLDLEVTFDATGLNPGVYHASLDVSTNVPSFNAADIDPGNDTKTLDISSNDPATQNISVPVTLVVIDNLPPVLSPVSNKSVVELGSLNLTFKATDPEDSLVAVSISGAPSFVTLTHSSNGLARYSIKPLIGDAGNYQITVMATDPLGGIDTAVFNLEVIAYGVQNFSLIYFETGQHIKDFKDSITLDVADPEIDQYIIRANTKPVKVGSVKFFLEGREKNTDSHNPYLFYLYWLTRLNAGVYTLGAQSFTKGHGKGEAGQTKEAAIRMINSAAITDFDLVNENGDKLADLEDGGIIDISQPGFGRINIIANTSINSVRSVRFSLNGKGPRVDNTAPFALKGNADGSNTSWSIKPGNYTVHAIPYMKLYKQGPAGTPLTIHFQVVNGVGPTVANARMADPGLEEEEEEEIFKEETGESVWKVYPVPVKDALHVTLEGKIEGEVSLNIINLQGQSVHAKEGTAETFRDYTVSTVNLGLQSGFYVIQIQQANGKRVVLKFVKE